MEGSQEVKETTIGAYAAFEDVSFERSMEDCMVGEPQEENLDFLGFTRDAFRELVLSIPTKSDLNFQTEPLESTLSRELEKLILGWTR